MYSIGSAISFGYGQFASHPIRAELIELQKANVGRKYTRKDRRPLDPPPVAAVKLFEVTTGQGGARMEREITASGVISSAGFLCHVDLIPVDRHNDISTPTQAIEPLKHTSVPNTFASSSITYLGSISRIASSPNATSGASMNSVSQNTAIGRPANAGLSANTSMNPFVHGTLCTDQLAGSTFVEATPLEYRGQSMLMFIFSDLSVKREGTYILRYRVFDIMSKAQDGPGIPILAECYGGPFEVFSTKTFPGLQSSTELTRYLSRFGIRVNSRETERRQERHEPSDAGSSGRPLRIAPATGRPAELRAVTPVPPPNIHGRGT
ncbi:hypothetical protein WOLCODRAFT_67286 [Wolfiporia cocos MD-104 SS10]|uniref:Velvet domain-containing protein n=1 Tax=Wolfiporia cocos (strain MD-104) TaxID=742152 RepID=A0A2H3JNI9_WOLCO|nr:hypothetical protein WOLCODRAFT_67286 [Wolfiporia cocos MD-104 SS10]